MAKNLVGEMYVVFGHSGGFPPSFALSTLDGSNGFRLDGIDEEDWSGFSVSSAGDVNGDGFDDLIIGAPWADPDDKNGAGETYVVFGHSGGFPPSFALSMLDGSNGFRLDGIDEGDWSGWSVSSAGDVNGDGFDDLIIGAHGANEHAGETYVVFSHSGGFPPSFALSTLDGLNGFRLDGNHDWHGSAFSVNSAGDINGDGFDDLIIGAPYSDAGQTYVVFGHSGGFPPTLALEALSGADGFQLVGGGESGWSVSSAGDVNGDGFDDLIIGARLPGNRAGATYVVFGHSGIFPPLFNLSILDGSNGFRLDGLSIEERIFEGGISVSSAGDVNGDGFDDLIIGARQVNVRGIDYAPVGNAYVIFGRSDGFLASMNLSALDGSNGFRLDDIGSGDSVSSAGDVNGDGFDDLIIGAPWAGLAGETYVVFGGNFTGGVETQMGDEEANTLIATQGPTAIDNLIGGQNNDLLISDGGSDVLRGGEGDDTLAILSTDFRRLAGGNGFDTLRLDGSGITLDLTAIADNKIMDIEQIDISGSGANTLTLNVLEVLNISTHSNALVVRKDADDVVAMGDGWIQQLSEVSGDETFNVFTQGAATLKVQTENNRLELDELAALQANFGSTNATLAQGDLSGDGKVTRADVVLLLQNYGQANDLRASNASASAPAAVVVGHFGEMVERSGDEQTTATRRAIRGMRDGRLAGAAVDVELTRRWSERSGRRAEGLSLRAGRSPRPVARVVAARDVALLTLADEF